MHSVVDWVKKSSVINFLAQRSIKVGWATFNEWNQIYFNDSDNLISIAITGSGNQGQHHGSYNKKQI